MVKKFLSVFAVSSMIFATSCSNEDFVSPATEGESLVNFAVEVPNGLNSRAYGDGTTATNLKYSVYEVDAAGEWNYIQALDGGATFTGLTTSVSLRLVNGKDYKVVFWASATDSPYTYNATNKNVTASYTGRTSNDETFDAFYAVEDIHVSASASQDVVLKRPFAQLNIGTADLVAYQTANGQTVSEAGIKVTNVYTTFSFEDEDVDGDAQEITFGTATRPAGETFPVTGYDYLTMNYLLVSKDKQTVDVTLNYGGAATPTYANVPVQRNYRTNIYGNLLTSSEDFNITINPGFDGTYDQSVWDGTEATTLTKSADGKYHITSANQLALLMKQTQNANSLYRGETFILDTDISFANQTITGIGCGNCNIVFTFDGNNHIISDFKIESASDIYAGLFQQFSGTVKNLTVKNATVKGNNMVGIIASNVENGGLIDKCTVENCTVIAVKKAGAITGYTVSSTVKNCVAKDVTVYCEDAREAQSGEIVGYINTGSTIVDNTATHVSVIRDCNNVEVVSVSSAADLLSLATNVVTNKHIILANDIDCASVVLTPIRLEGNSTFDGAGYKMTNVTTGVYNGRTSIFCGEIHGTTNATIKNLTIDGVLAEGNSSVPFAGVLYGDMQNGINVTIDNVHIYNAEVKNAETVGGFVGLLSGAGENTLAIKNSSVNNTTITGIEEDRKIGAFVGRAVKPYTCDNVVADNVTCFNNTTQITTVPEGTKSESKCTTGYTIR